MAKVKSYDFSSHTPDWAAKLRQDYMDENNDLTKDNKAAAIMQQLNDAGVDVTPEIAQKVQEAVYNGQPFNIKDVVNPVPAAPAAPEKFSLENMLKYNVANVRAQKAQQDITDARVLESGRGFGDVPGRLLQNAAEEAGQPVSAMLNTPMLPTTAGAFGQLQGVVDTATKTAEHVLSSVAGLTDFVSDKLSRIAPVLDSATTGDIVNNPFHRLAAGQSILPSKDELVEQAVKKAAAAKPVLAEQNKIAQDLAPTLPSKIKYASDVADSLVSTPEQALPTAGGVVGSFFGPPGAAVGAALGSVPIARRTYNDAFVDAKDNLKATDDEAQKYATIVSAIQMGTETIGGPAEAGVLKLAESMGLKKLTKEAARDWILQKAKSRVGSAIGTAGRIAGASAIEGVENIAGTAGQDILEQGMEKANTLSSPEARAALHERNAENSKNRLDRYIDSGAQGALAGAFMAGPIAGVGGVSEQKQITADRKLRTATTKAGLESALTKEMERNAPTQTEEQGTQGKPKAPTAPKEKQRVRAVETIGGTVFEPVSPTGTGGQGTESPATGVPTEQRADRPIDMARRKVAELQGTKTPTKQQFKAMRDHLKANPAATAAELVEVAKPTKKPTKPDKSQTESELDALGEQLDSMGMAAENTSKPANISPDHKRKVGQIVRTLVKNTSQQSSDLQSLAAQERMVIAPNAKSIGRQDNPDAPRQGEFDPETGKLYLYTDHIKDTSNLKSILPTVLHEAVHGGTRSTNDTRSAIYTTLLGKDGVMDAAGKIRVAAKHGNKLAISALKLAQGDTDARKGDSKHENEELVAYFTSEAAKARKGVFGTVGGVVTDIRSKARQTVRDKLGLDLDFNLNDLDSASQGVAHELAVSKQRTGKGDTLAMIAGPSAKNFNKAEQKGKTYPGARDNIHRFEIPDNKAELSTGAINNLDRGDGETLGNLKNHPELYENYPDLKNIKIVPKEFGRSAYGSYEHETNSILVNADVIHRAKAIPDAPAYGTDHPELTNKEFLRRIILHETQHAIQAREGFISGTNERTFIPNTTVSKRDRAREAYKNVFDNFDLGRAIATLPPAAKATWNNEVKEIGSNNHHELVAMFLQQEYYKDSSDRMIQRYGTKYQEALENLQNANEEYDIARAKAYDTYLRDYGETEARNTEHRSRMTDEELAANPPESTMQDARGNIPVERTLDTTPYMGGRRALPASSGSNTLYRDTNADGAVDMVEGMVRNMPGLSTKKNSAFAATSPDLALGQGRNTGIMVELDPEGYNVEDSNSKPAAGLLTQQGEGEKVLTNKTGINSGEYVKSVTLKKGWRKNSDPAYAERLLLRMRQQNWNRTENPDGTITYTNPKYSSPSSLGMAADSEEQGRARWAPALFTSLFRNDQGLGKEINAIVEHARTSASGDRMRAESLLGNYEDALGNLAKERGVDPQTLDKEIGKALDAIDNDSDSYDENLTKFVDVASKYGEAGQALIDLRNQVDDLTMDIIRQRVAAGGKMTKAEMKRYQTLRNNMGRYVHRLYAAYQGKAGTKYAKKVMDAYSKKKKGKDLTPAQEENYQLVADAVRELVDNSLSIPSDEGLAHASVDRLRRLYSTWGTENAEEMNQDELREKLAEMRDAVNGDKDRLTNMAEEVTQELMGLADTTQPMARYFRGSKLDTGILQERSKIPPALRAVMGEITTPAPRLMATVGKQAEFVARNKMLLEMRKFVGTDLQPPESVGTDVVVNNKMKKLEGEGWGALEGWYASPNMRNLLGDVVQHNATFEQAAAMASTKPDQLFNDTVVKIFNGWSKIAGASKMLQVVGKLTMFPINFTGAFRMLASNGNFNPVNVAKGLSTASQVIAYAINPKVATEQARLVSKYGITDSAMIGELKTMDYRQIQNLVKEMANKKPAGRAKVVADVVRKGLISFKELYAMMDVWSKLSNFYHQVDVLKDFYEKNGTPKTDDEIYREAADNVNRTNITYKRAAPIIKVIERGGVTQFGTYFYETFRSEVGNIAQGISEIQKARDANTPEARNAMLAMASKRLIGQAMSWAAVAYVSRALAALTFGDDRDKEDKLRKLLPDYAQTQDFLPVGVDKDGKPVLANISMIDPIGPVTDFLRQALNGEGSPEEMWKQFKQLYVEPRIVPQLAKAVGTTFPSVFGNVRPTKQPLLKQLFPNGYEDVLNATGSSAYKDKTLKAWLNVGETFLPGTLNSWRDSNPHPVGDDPNSIAWSAVSYGGMYMYQLNPDAAARDAGFAYKDAMKSSRKDLSDFFSDHPNADLNQTILAVTGLRQDEKAAWQKARDAYQGMEAAGMSPTAINKALKDGGVSASALPSVRRGEFKSQLINKDSIDGFMGNEMKGKTKEQQKEIKAKWKDIWHLLSAAKKSGEE